MPINKVLKQKKILFSLKWKNYGYLHIMQSDVQDHIEWSVLAQVPQFLPLPLLLGLLRLDATDLLCVYPLYLPLVPLLPLLLLLLHEFLDQLVDLMLHPIFRGGGRGAAFATVSFPLIRLLLIH